MSVPNLQEIRKPQIRDQIQYIVSEFQQEGAAEKVGELGSRNAGRVDIGVKIADGGMQFMFAEGQILVREHYLEQVHEILGRPKRDLKETADTEQGHARVEPLIAGVVVLHLAARQDEPHFTVLEALDRIDRVLGPGYATPNHVLTVTGDAGPCPATEPEIVYDGMEPYPSVCAGDAGAGISVYVADTGLLWYPGDQPANPQPHDIVTNEGTVHPWLKGVRGTLDKVEDLTGGNVIGPYEAHGTFVAGVARCMAPAAKIHVANVFKVAGSTLETPWPSTSTPRSPTATTSSTCRSRRRPETTSRCSRSRAG